MACSILERSKAVKCLLGTRRIRNERDRMPTDLETAQKDNTGNGVRM